MNLPIPSQKISPKDFASDQEVRWCPGCGDYAILKAIQQTLAEMNRPKEKTVFVSGIGCSSRFPYYLSTYGFHTIHGRAPAIASGIKLANPELDVWVISGDGDGISIGGNHLLHLLRRNLDVQFLLFNNEIYGLTKGQYSPTSREGTLSPSSPRGSIGHPVSPSQFALGAGARFVARAIDSQPKTIPSLMKRAHAYKGASFVEIYQNCIVYNDGVFSDFTDKDIAEERQIHVEHGQPLIFGKEKDKGLYLKPGTLDIIPVKIGENGITREDILVHDETSLPLANGLVTMGPPLLPVALGVIYCHLAPSYERQVLASQEAARDRAPSATIDWLLHQGHTWEVTD